MLLPVTCEATDGPHTNGSYLWAKFDDLQKAETRIMQGPYIHHFIEIEGDVTAELSEFCRFIVELTLDNL